MLVYERMLREPELEKVKLSGVLKVSNVKESINVLYRDISKLSGNTFYKKYGETKEKVTSKRPNRSLSMLGIQCSRAYYKAKKSFGLRITYKVHPVIGARSHKLLYKFKVLNSWWFWRELWQRRIDKILYLDWDPIPSTDWGIHTSDYFLEQNRELAMVIGPEELTDEYYRLGNYGKKN